MFPYLCLKISGIDMGSSHGVIAQHISYTVRNNLETKVKNKKLSFFLRKEIIKTLESLVR